MMKTNLTTSDGFVQIITNFFMVILFAFLAIKVIDIDKQLLLLSFLYAQRLFVTFAYGSYLW